ncbi:hypothetical protein ALC60_03573 [Trachymyrmex zeteki]|uniref:Uncharacterized protein n=1 Tax=Mycetomoellerius zeteki TaxID=64791 RepID=A0A151XB55_9HYME|nr:hypothetical protein ALC60_03573 [Trachymyrmex zeteki]
MHFGCSCEFVRASNARVHELFMRRDVASAASAARSFVVRGGAPGPRAPLERAGGMISLPLPMLEAKSFTASRISSTVARAKDRQGTSPRKRRERVPLWRRSLLDQGSRDMARGMSSNEGEVKGKQVK